MFKRLSVVFAALILLAGCGTSNPTPTPTPKPVVKAPPWDKGMEHKVLPLPPGLAKQIKVSAGPLPPPKAGYTYVSSVPAYDVPGLDLAPLVNAAAQQYGIYAPGLLMILGGECGLYTHSTRCDRWGYGADVSFGACQVTVNTFNGTLGTNYNPYAVRDYENDASRCIYLAARILAGFAAYERSVGCYAAASFPSLAVAWNSGPAQPCYFLSNPYGQAGANWINYQSWWRWALSKAINYDPKPTPRPTPKPHRKPFPAGQWNRYTSTHHLPEVTYKWHGGIARVAWAWAYDKGGRINARCGGVKYHEVWDAKRHVMHQAFSHGKIFSWPTKKHDPIEVVCTG